MLIYILFLFFALAPVFVWLCFYLKKDRHPEPKKMILKVFIAGMSVACFAAVVEAAFSKLLGHGNLTSEIVKSFLLAGFFEETMKYLAAKKYSFKSKELDEPIDFMIYMIVAALGFVAVENIILLFAVDYSYTIASAFWFMLFRFVGAILLHTLTSGSLGFFIALSLRRNKKSFFLLGFAIAVFMHGFYNFSIAYYYSVWRYLAPMLVLAVLSIVAGFGFSKLKGLRKIS